MQLACRGTAFVERIAQVIVHLLCRQALRSVQQLGLVAAGVTYVITPERLPRSLHIVGVAVRLAEVGVFIRTHIRTHILIHPGRHRLLLVHGALGRAERCVFLRLHQRAALVFAQFRGLFAGRFLPLCECVARVFQIRLVF